MQTSTKLNVSVHYDYVNMLIQTRHSISHEAVITVV